MYLTGTKRVFYNFSEVRRQGQIVVSTHKAGVYEAPLLTMRFRLNSAADRTRHALRLLVRLVPANFASNGPFTGTDCRGFCENLA